MHFNSVIKQTFDWMFCISQVVIAVYCQLKSAIFESEDDAFAIVTQLMIIHHKRAFYTKNIVIASLSLMVVKKLQCNYKNVSVSIQPSCYKSKIGHKLRYLFTTFAIT